MKNVVIRGVGAISPAGWSAGALSDALRKDQALPTREVFKPGSSKPLPVRAVPRPGTPLARLSHPRLRRVSAITQYIVAAATEALGGDAVRAQDGELKLGIVVCLMAGCVSYSRRFYEEVLNDPATASPLLFPETVFHAPASHLAASLNSEVASYTIVGDESSFLQGTALAARWLIEGQVDGCLVVGGEEMDWIVTDAVQLFERGTIHSEGAGALYLALAQPQSEEPLLECVTDALPFTARQDRAMAAREIRAQLAPDRVGRVLLCESAQGVARVDDAERSAWRGWPGERLAVRKLLGNAFTASAAWQCCAACHAIRSGSFDAAIVSVVGTNQHAIGARFVAAFQ